MALDYTRAVEYLIKKGKRKAAAFIQIFCSDHTNPDVTNGVFDSILNPNISIDDWDTIEWCRWLLAGGETPEDFAQTGNKEPESHYKVSLTHNRLFIFGGTRLN